MATNTAGEITESRIDEVSLVFQGADQDSELVVLTKSVIEEPVVEDEEDSEEGESEEGNSMDESAEKQGAKAAGFATFDQLKQMTDKACDSDMKPAEMDKDCKVKKAYEDLLAVAPAEWPEEIQKGLTDAVLSLYAEQIPEESILKSDGRFDVIEQGLAKIQGAIDPLAERITAIEGKLEKTASVEPVEKTLTDDEILAKASEIEAARKQAAKPAVVQKSINPRLLDDIATLQGSVEKLKDFISREMGVSAKH